MADYLGQIQVNSSGKSPLASTLYGVCSTGEMTGKKVVTLPEFKKLIHGVTVHVKFIFGNVISVGDTLKLQVGPNENTTFPIACPGGSPTWSPGQVISFTYDANDKKWIANDSNQQNINIQNVYDPLSTDPISGQGVADALAPITSGNSASSLGVDTEIGDNPTNSKVPTSKAVANYVLNNGLMIFKGNITSISGLPIRGYKIGWVYRINTAGTYLNQPCEVGDLILAIQNASDYQTQHNPAHWTIVQANLDQLVHSPDNSVAGHVVIFGEDSQHIDDSGYTIATSVPPNAVFTDTHYEDKSTVSAVTSISDGTEFTLASIVAGTLNIKRGLNITTATVSTGIQEVT